MPQVEKKFGIEEGDFVFDPTEAYKAGTPSYYYRTMTEKKENELTSEFEKTHQKTQEALTKMVENRNLDLKHLKETYFAEDEEGFINSLSAIDEMTNKMKEGDFSAEANPFSLRNIFRGVHFESLMNKALESQANEIHKQYADNGLYLPDDETEVTDVTKMKGKPPSKPNEKAGSKFSPLRRSLSQYN